MKKKVFFFSAEFTDKHNTRYVHGSLQTKMSPFDDGFMDMIYASIAEDFKSVCDLEESIILNLLVVRSLTLIGEETYYEKDNRIDD